jgi:hypothetical protein
LRRIEIMKCAHCETELKTFSDKCPFCGGDLEGVSLSSGLDGATQLRMSIIFGCIGLVGMPWFWHYALEGDISIKGILISAVVGFVFGFFAPYMPFGTTKKD